MKKLTLSITLCLSTLLFADNCSKSLPSDYCDNKPNPCCDYLPPCINGKYLSTHPKKGFNFQFIFSQPAQEGMDFVINNSSATEGNGKSAQPDFEWFVGARGGIEYIYNYDLWKLNLNATILRSNEKARQKREVINQTNILEPFNNLGLIPLWNHPRSYAGYFKNIRYTESKAKWKEDFYSLNLMLEKDFCLTKQITFLPSFGLGSIYIFDTYKIKYNRGKTFPISDTITLNPTSSFSHNIQDTIGLGPRVGMDSRFYFFSNVNFFTKIYGSLLYTYYSITRHDIDNFTILGENPSLDNWKMKHHFTSIKPNIELTLGISYENCITYQRKAPTLIELFFGYGFSYFWKKNQYLLFADDVDDGLYYPAEGDFHLQELHLGINCLF